jgi:hypothetical protein
MSLRPSKNNDYLSGSPRKPRAVHCATLRAFADNVCAYQLTPKTISDHSMTGLMVGRS